MKQLTKAVQLIIACISVFLVACAGAEETPLNEPSARVAEEVTNVVESIGAADDCYLRELLVQDFLTAINAARADSQVCQGVGFSPAPALTSNLRLQNAAVNHSDDMALVNFFSHTGSDGLSGGSRVDAEGYPWTRIGENLAAGQSDVNTVIDEWLVSTEGHCELLMDPLMTEMGGSCKTGGPLNLFASYWTLMLGNTE